MKSYKVGEMVTVRKDLTPGHKYFIYCNDHMIKYAGKHAKIVRNLNSYSYRLCIDGRTWEWTCDMFEDGDEDARLC